MIKTVYGGSEFLSVNSYDSSPYVNISNLGAGNLRFNPMNRSIEVYDGSSWQMMGGDAEVRLSSEADDILRWARQKKREEEKMLELAKTNPTIADALTTFQKAEEQLKVVTALCEELTQ